MAGEGGGGGGGAAEEERMVAEEGDGGDEEEGKMALPPVGTEDTLASDTRPRRRNSSSKTVDTSCSPRNPEECQLYLTCATT